MLKRLELIGFKSFADRTRFDFAPGVTAVVGPNGSGKSNVVDAVRWLLGEQSAKNLRGGEMTDVIFNGSSARKSLGMAEATMTFDNAARVLNADADEVQITRRVFRDGEGEYQVNGRPARLKDVKDLFLGSGAGHGAYSIIEQGRVDALLAATTKDRRLVIEEAAGISRFKAKKVESLRKLERVDADLLRVRDILAELDKQLRTLRLQAAKAERYQEYTARLRGLRVGLARGEFRELTAALVAEEAALAEARADLADGAAKAEAGEAGLRKLDWELSRTADALRHQEAKRADARQQIALHESTAKNERTQAANLDAELLRVGRQRAELTQRTRAVETDAARTAAELAAATAAADAGRDRAESAAAALTETTARIAAFGRQIQADREQQVETVRQSAHHHSAAESARTAAEQTARELARRRAEAEGKAAKYRALDAALEDLSRTDADLQGRLATAKQRHADHTAARDRFRAEADARQADLDARRERRSALRGRAEVLEGLEREWEGFGAGVRAVVARLSAGDGVLSPAVVGLVADLLAVPRDVAPLVDLALGDAAQRFVVLEGSLDAVLAALGEVPGRVGFVPVSSVGRVESSRPAGLGEAYPAGLEDSTRPTRLSDFARSDPPGLAAQLLGHVLLADDLAAARTLTAAHPGCRVVTRAGELLEPDGTVVVGPAQAGAGILSRRSELRDLVGQLAALDADITAVEAEQAALRGRADALDDPLRTLDAEIATLSGAAGSLRDQILEQRQVQRQLAETLDAIAQESALLEADHGRAEAARRAAADRAAAADRDTRALADRLAAAETALAAAERDRIARQDESTTAQVDLGRLRELAAGLRAKRDGLDAELRQRRIDGVNLASAEKATRGRLTDSHLAALRATAAAAYAYADKEARDRQAAEWTARRAETQAARGALDAGLRQSRDGWATRREAAHARDLAAGELRSRRDGVARRIQDDYGLDLASEDAGEEWVELVPADAPPPPDPHQEIAELRRKIDKLGSVNLEALAELAEVERRDTELRGQHDDLADARDKLRAIIDQINADSRRLFSETLAAVRGHFQELFRKLFAGGQADIFLEDEADVLEGGIEITARPPGKELRSISLMSGGEKALTAVALLLAVFRSKPSPFCLLDEVDAAMDEANTQRLASLLTEFADRSQFVVITHKKRTMAAAAALYGVTMQEGGVSKLVSVRFEDWPDDPAEPARAAA
jgi:chromosome segregation protein